MANIYCKRASNGQIKFYLQANGKEYYLFQQAYYTSVWNYFSSGVEIHQVFNKSGKHSYALRKTKMKLPAYIQYVEREEGVFVLNKTKEKGVQEKGKRKRGKCRIGCYNWRKDVLADIV